MFCWRAGGAIPWPVLATRVPGDPHGRCIWSLERRCLAGRGRVAGVCWPAATTAPGKAAPRSQNTLFSAMQEGSPRHMDSDGVVLVQRHHLHLPDLRAALRLPLPEAAVRADRQVGRGRRQAALPRQGRQGAARRRAQRPGRRKRLRRPHQARHPVPAASGVRQGRQRQLPVPPPEAGRARATLVAAASSRMQGTRELVADDFVYALKRHATPRITTPIYGIFSEYVIGLKDYGDADQARGRAAARGPRSGQPRPAVPRLPQVPARRRHRARQVHVPRAHQGPLSAVELLDGDDLHGAGAVGGRRVLRAAGHGRGQPHARHLAGGHRPVHADRVPPGSPPGDGAQPELPRRAVSVRRHAGRQGSRPARRLRQEDAVRRQDRDHRRARAGAAARPSSARATTTSRCSSAPTRASSTSSTKQNSEEIRKDYDAKGFRLDRFDDVNSYTLGFNMLDPVIGKGATPEQQEQQPQAAPGHLDRDRLGGVRQDLPAARRRHRDGPDPQRHLRLAREARPRASTRSRTGSSTACRCGARSTRRSS